MSIPAMNNDLLASGLFSACWAEMLCLCWNDNPAWHGSMASAGEIGFVLELPDEVRTLVLFWDETGRIDTTRDLRAANRPEFRGPLGHWAAVMRADVTPAGAVLRGQLSYRGPLWFAARYANAFTNIVQAQRQALSRPEAVLPEQSEVHPSQIGNPHE